MPLPQAMDIQGLQGTAGCSDAFFSNTGQAQIVAICNWSVAQSMQLPAQPWGLDL